MAENYQRLGGDISIVARDAPFGNEFTSPLGVYLRSGRLIYYDLNNSSPNLSSSEFDILNCDQERTPPGSEFELENRDMPVNNGKTVLPLILPNNLSPNGAAKYNNDINQLAVKNGNLSLAEEQELIKDIIVSLQNMDVVRLKNLETEIADYDPYQRGLVDASSLQRILAKFFKLIPLSAGTSQKLFRLFATDVKRPRQIQYVQLVQYMAQIREFMGQNLNDSSLTNGKTSNLSTPGSSMAQSPFYKRGDAKLILELQLALQQANVREVDVESVRRTLNVLDRGHNGTLSREQVENVLKNFQLYKPLENVMPQLLQRCDLTNDEQYDWATMVRFLEKAHLAIAQEPAPTSITKRRRDMCSSLDSPGSTPSNGSSYFPPISNNFHIQQNGNNHYQSGQTTSNNGVDHKKLLEENEIQMKALALRRQQLEEELRMKQKQKTESNETPKNIDTRPRSASKLIEQLKKLDSTNSGYVSTSNARKVIQQYNDLHELGLNSKFLQHILTLCSNDNETHVNLEQLSKYLNNAFK